MPGLGSPDTSELVPDFNVRVNGSPLPDEVANDLVSIAVYEDVDVPSMFTLRLVTWDMMNLEMTWVDDNRFKSGNEAVIEMGYVDSLEALLTAEITGLEPEFVAGEVPVLVVRGYDRRHRLLRGHKTQSFLKMKDSDIAKKIASGAGLSAKVVATKAKHEYVLQHNQTDMEFLQDRARRIGYEVAIDGKTLLFRPHQITRKGSVTLDFEADLTEFYPRLTSVAQRNEVTVRGWDIMKKQAIVSKGTKGQKNLGSAPGSGTAKSAFGNATLSGVDRPVATKIEADEIAAGRFDDMALAYISAEGACDGRTDLRAGSVIEIAGVGNRFSGDYYVTSTTHIYSPQEGYQTRFTARRNATNA